MKIALNILKMAALVYLLISLAFGLLAFMVGGNLWQGVMAIVMWPMILWPIWFS